MYDTGNVSSVQELAKNQTINDVDIEGSTALHWAAEYGNSEINAVINKHETKDF